MIIIIIITIIIITIIIRYSDNLSSGKCTNQRLYLQDFL